MPIVTISRGSMIGGQTLAECLSRVLSAPCIGREIVVEAAAKLGVPHSLLQDKIEKSPGFFERFSSERRTYVLAVQTALASHAATGNLVYHGQAGHLLLRGLPCVLRVRLIAPLAARIRAVTEGQGVSANDAEAYIRRLDDERARWTRAMYGVDVSDASLYDLVVNLETITIHTACGLIGSVLAQPEYQVDDDALGMLRDFAEACRTQLDAHQGLRATQGKPRVLVVDGHETTANGLAEKLREHRYPAAVASSGADAIRRARTEKHDVILLDLDLGLGLLRELRALDPKVPVVLVTSHGSVASAIEGMQIGAADYLHKPLDFEVLCRAIDAAAETARSNRSEGG